MRGAHLQRVGRGRPSRARSALFGDVAPVVFLLAAALAWCYPAVTHGAVYGSYDLLGQVGLGTGLASHSHNALTSDQVFQDSPWLFFDTSSLRHLVFPLWNPLNGLGTPQFLDFQSGVLSFPSLVAGLFPPFLAYGAQVVVKLFVSGTGVYVASRVLGVSRKGSTFAGLVGELAGPIAAWAGWPQVAVSEWTGWIIAGGVLVMSQRRRPWHFGLLAVTVAFAIYGGFPEMVVLCGLGVVVFLALYRVLSGRGVTPKGSLAWLLGGAGTGLALAAPLWLPGIAVLRASVIWGRGGDHQPAAGALGILTNGYFGYPLSNSQWFGPFNYNETAAYVGIPVLVLAVAALASRQRARRNIAVAALVTAFLEGALAYGLWPISWAALHIPVVGSVELGRAVVPMVTFLALASGVGLDSVLEEARSRLAWRARSSVLVACAGVLGAAGLLAYLWRQVGSSVLTAAQQVIRTHSLYWPIALAGVMAAFLLVAVLRPIPAVVPAGGLVLAQAIFLVSVGAPMNTWGRSFFPTDAAISNLRRDVGSSLVAFGSNPSGPQGDAELGLPPEANLAYGLAEFATYDGTTPLALEEAWAEHSGASAAQRKIVTGSGHFEPAITNATEAELFGVGYVLFPKGSPPSGTSGLSYVATLGNELLYRAPGVSRASFSPASSGSVTSPVAFVSDNEARIGVHAARAGWLDVRITDSAGWSATTNGQPALLRSWDTGMIKVWVPAGKSTVLLRYWPPLLTLALVLAGVAFAGLGGLLLASGRAQSPSRSTSTRRTEG